MVRNFVFSVGIIMYSLSSLAWRSSNGNHAMWEELNKKSPDCAAIFRTTFRKTEASSSQSSVKDTYVYEAPNGKAFVDSEINFAFSTSGDSSKDAQNAQKIDAQLTKAEKGLKESKKTLAEVMAVKPAGEQVPDDEEKNIFSKICSMVADTGFRDKPPCPADMKGFKLNPQIILCKDAKAVAGKKK